MSEDKPKTLFSEQDEEAAANYHYSLNLFLKKLQKMKSMSEMARVFREIAEFPLASSKPTFNNKRQEDLFLTFLTMSEYKNQILTAILQKGDLPKGENNVEEESLAESSDPS